MAWIQVESFRVRSPAFADELVRRKAFEGLEPAGETVASTKLRRWARNLELAFFGPDFGDVDVKEADRVRHELVLRRGLVPFDLREPADAVSLQAAMQGRPRQTGYGRLQSSSGRRVWRRNATMIASSSTDSTEDFGSLGPVGRSATDDRFLHLNTVLGLTPYRVAGTLRLS
jgi:hypothetical protein